MNRANAISTTVLLRMVLRLILTIVISSVISSAQTSLSLAEEVSDSTGAQFSYQKELPRGRYFANSGHWYAVVNEAIEKTALRAQEIFGDYHLPQYSLYLVDSEQEFLAFVGNGFPDWGGAVAIPSRNTIVLKSPSISVGDKPLHQLAAHEYAHLVVYQLSHTKKLSGATGAPRWLDEGMAMYLSSEWGVEDFLTISRASLTGGFVPLSSYDSLNLFGKNRAQVAYAQSYLAVKYLIDYYDAATVANLLAELRNGNDIDEALQTVIGLDQAGVEAELFGYIYEHFTLVGVLMNSSIFWIALAALVVIGAYRARKRKAARYAQWDEEEKLQSTDFEYGDPDNPEKVDDEDKPWE